MSFSGYELLQFERHGPLLMATVANPPVNLVTPRMVGELAGITRQLESSNDILVFVLQSADPDFFLAHFDVEALLARPIDGPATRGSGANNAMHELGIRFSNLPQITIAQIEGRVGGGGAEFAMTFDMRFGVTGRTILNQMEVPLGIVPGGGGTQRLPALIGYARAVEVILTADDIDAATLNCWGWLNRCFDPEDVNASVRRLAERISRFSPEAVFAAKRALRASRQAIEEGLVREDFESQILHRTPASRAALRRFLDRGGQRRATELRIAELFAPLGSED